MNATKNEATKIDMTIPIRKISFQLESYRNTSQSTIKVSRATKSQDTMPRLADFESATGSCCWEFPINSVSRTCTAVEAVEGRTKATPSGSKYRVPAAPVTEPSNPQRQDPNSHHAEQV
jgi:hypothetical protein